MRWKWILSLAVAGSFLLGFQGSTWQQGASSRDLEFAKERGQEVVYLAERRVSDDRDLCEQKYERWVTDELGPALRALDVGALTERHGQLERISEALAIADPEKARLANESEVPVWLLDRTLAMPADDLCRKTALAQLLFVTSRALETERSKDGQVSAISWRTAMTTLGRAMDDTQTVLTRPSAVFLADSHCSNSPDSVLFNALGPAHGTQLRSFECTETWTWLDAETLAPLAVATAVGTATTNRDDLAPHSAAPGANALLSFSLEERAETANARTETRARAIAIVELQREVRRWSYQDREEIMTWMSAERKALRHN
jgi:hypothetical protein